MDISIGVVIFIAGLIFKHIFERIADALEEIAFNGVTIYDPEPDEDEDVEEDTMIVNVELWAFADGKVREISIPEHVFGGDLIQALHYIFSKGQNEFDSQESPSVSVGDVILFRDERYMVATIGYKTLTDEEYTTLKEKEGSVQRILWAYHVKGDVFTEPQGKVIAAVEDYWNE